MKSIFIFDILWCVQFIPQNFIQFFSYHWLWTLNFKQFPVYPKTTICSLFHVLTVKVSSGNWKGKWVDTKRWARERESSSFKQSDGSWGFVADYSSTSYILLWAFPSIWFPFHSWRASLLRHLIPVCVFHLLYLFRLPAKVCCIFFSRRVKMEIFISK